jgi:zinc protease
VRDVATPLAETQPEPLAIAEQPWNAPPWMAPRRPSSFTQPAPTLRHSALRFPETPFTPPDRAGYEHCLRTSPCAYIVPEETLPLTRVTLFVDAPSTRDPVGKEGLSDLLAAILRRAGSASRTREQFEQALARLNATLTIETGVTGPRLHLLSPPDGAAQALELLGELVSDPAIDAVFEAERERAAISVERAADAPGFQARLLFDRALYAGAHPLARRPTAASVRAIGLNDVRALYESRYRMPYLALGISGRVQRRDVEAAIESGFKVGTVSVATPSALAAPQGAPPGVSGRAVVTRDLDIRQAHVHIGHAGIAGSPEDHAALEVMNYILSGGGFVSRMMKLLRTDTGITSALYGSVEPGRGVVNPYLWSFTGAPETIARGVRLALEQIETMREKGVSEEEFQAARTAYIDGLVPASYETAHLVATRLATKALFGLYDYHSPQYLNYYAGDADQLAALRRLTREDVNRAARRYLDPVNIVIAVAGPMALIQEHATAEERPLVSGR